MAAPLSDPPALHDRALQDLSFIRRTMEGAASFTDVPGWGLVWVGATALVAAPLADAQSDPARWLTVWMAAATMAASIGGAAMYAKMRKRVGDGDALRLSVPARKFLFSFWPAILVGAVLTCALVDPYTPGIPSHLTARVLPGLWLLLYGMGVTTAGSFSIRAVPLMGFGFITLGVLALFVPAADGDLMMALGFGVLHLVFGVRIARRHGG
ncbi:hypothetical protein [Gemmatimonas groenlandica]|uniref:Uncharacterized protein n=1 Tax=Gemmatimonas groenlandica TaxID=2732249 RepID=A0A6M4IWF2_9BACT|nr:hypothetical protein [Gemmatimonas groenlandica]QJR37222.1 hypothetical protein HKW67_17710 [Gemmatimonas groenlandica]